MAGLRLMRVSSREGPLTAATLEWPASLGLAALLGFSILYKAPSIISGTDVGLDPSQGGGGSVLTQLVFIGLFLTIVGGLLRSGRHAVLVRTPRFLVVSLTWCWLSLLWASDPGASFRRLMYLTLVYLSVCYLVEILTYDRLMRVLGITLGIVIVADWIAILIFPEATRDLLLDADGGWRGLHLTKNEAGAFCANCLIFFVFETVRSRSRLTGPLLCIATVVFLIETQSKTSIGFAGTSILVGAIASAAQANTIVRNVALVGFLAGILTSIGAADLVGSQLQLVIDDPAGFTGRSQIWATVLDYVRDHPLLGAGYGSFWGIGDDSPILTYGGGWLASVYEAHNGYLDLLVNIGLVGLILGVSELIVRPLAVVFVHALPTGVSRAMLCALVTFTSLHNLLESTFLDRAAPAWVLALLAYSILFKARAEVKPALSREAGQLAPASLRSNPPTTAAPSRL